ncbi:MAG: tetratricopeptide repeat protein [Candidatus Glassbacteria bacterium]|nr:tetratricopeptide repeat protein [Candidatus Glassbacteria bacterium]
MNNSAKNESGGRGKPKAIPAVSQRQKALLFLIGLFCIVFVELTLRLIPAQSQKVQVQDPFVGFSAVNPLFTRYVADDGTARLKTSPDKLTLFNAQDFKLEKNPGTFRIFTLGGSTTYGRPYADRTSFGGWLRTLLNYDGGSGAAYEVINAGGISYASYRVCLILEELLRYSPDLFVVYTGHNEFLEARTYGNLQSQSSLVFKMRKLLSGLKIYGLLKKAVHSTGIVEVSLDPERSVLAPEVRTMLDSSAGLDLYERDSLFANGVFVHFRFNIRRIKTLCQQAGVPVVFLDPVDNIKDFSPFKSQGADDLAPDISAELSVLISESRSHLAAGQPADAVSKLTRAVGLDSLDADNWFLLGRACLAAGDTASAAGYLHLARELDVCPLRAQHPVHRILGEEMAGADDPPLLDLPDLFRRLSPGGLIGQELLIDHIHPRPETNLRIALFILEWMIDTGYAGGNSYPASAERVTEIIRAVYQDLPDDYEVLGIVKLARVLFWAKKFLEGLYVLDSHWESLYQTPEAQFLRGRILLALEQPDEALGHFREAYNLAPEEKVVLAELADLYGDLGEIDRATEVLREGIKQFPDDAFLLAEYGMLLARSGNPDHAMRMIQKAGRLEPDNLNIRLNIGNVYSMAGMYRQAEKAYLESIELDPENSDAWYSLANVQIKLNKLEEAEKDFQKAISLDRNNSHARLNLGNLYLITRRFKEAENAYRLALKSKKTLPGIYENLAKLYVITGDDSSAKKIAHEGLELFPRDSILNEIVSSNQP